jgi:hypothetical protein
MLRKVLPLIIAMVMFPLFASAATFWQITATTSPAALKLNLTPARPANFGNYTTPNGGPTTKVIDNTITSVNFDVNVPSGYALTNVKVDGAVKGTTAGTYTVNKGIQLSHTIVASYTTVTYTITTIPVANGSISPSTTYSTSSPITVTPSNGFQLTGVVIDNTTYALAASLPAFVTRTINPVGATYTFTTGNHTIQGLFATLPSATAVILTPSQTVAIGATGIEIDGSASTSNVPNTTYDWTATCGTVTPTATNAKTATFDAPTTTGSCVVMLTVTATGVSPKPTASVTYTIVSPVFQSTNSCLSCHNGIDGPAVPGFTSSVHYGVRSCADCHNPGGIASHAYILSASNVSQTTFQVLANNQIPGLNVGDNFCSMCHSPTITADFTASPHFVRAGAASCSFCHATIHNPNVACVDCHKPGNSFDLPWPPTGLDFHSDFTGTNLCTNCHSLHNPSKITGVPYPHFSTYSTAQYVTKNISCNNCHKAPESAFKIYSANREWATSGKANPKSPAYIGPGPYTEANLEAYDYKFLGTPLPAKPSTTSSQDCVRCHTTTGFINYVTPTDSLDPNTAFSDIHAWGVPGDRTREMVACSACHNNDSGFDATFSRRSIGVMVTNNITGSETKDVLAWYSYSSAATKKFYRLKTYLNPNDGNMNDSNLCIACHAGKAGGDLIKLTTNCATLPSIACRVGATGTFWGTVDFIDPHNMSTANLMIPDGMKAGYEYRTIVSIPAHITGIGSENTQGPCVGCHMTSPSKHSFSVVSTASNGIITAITSNICSTCHGVTAFPIDPVTLQAKKDGYQASLSVVTALLAVKANIYYNATNAPYFFTTVDPFQQTFANRTVNWNFNGTYQGANLMGAAFNLRLLQSGSGFVHNSTYVKRLIYDTIDYLDDGIPTNDTVAVTIQNLAGIDQTTKNRATAYIVPRQ